MKIITKNRKAYHDYFIDETLEAGIELKGVEVKSVRNGNVNLKDGWVSVNNAEAFVNNMHIGPYSHGNLWNEDPYRVRKLLLHKREITRLLGLVKQKGLTLVPLMVYFKGGRLKLEVGVCRGKKLHDKRETAKIKDMKRESERAMKDRG